MSILCWNVRGLNKAAHVLEVKNIVFSQKPSMFCLIENKLRRNKIQLFMESWGNKWTCINNIEYHHKCRILIMINSDLWSSYVISMSKQHITCMLNNTAGAQCIVTVIYALNLESERKTLWKQLEKEANTFITPWCIIGDFNCVRFLKDKMGGNKLTTRNIQELNNFINSAGVKELSISGVKYSWRSGPNKNIATKIDRLLCNIEWMNMFKSSHAKYLDLSTSDHVPIMFQFNHTQTLEGPKPFKFRNHWVKCEGYKEAIEKHFVFPEENQLFNLIQM